MDDMHPTSSAPRRRHALTARHLGALAAAALTSLGLTACGGADKPEAVGAPVVLTRTASPTGSTTPTPTGATSSGTTSPGAVPVAAVVRDRAAELDVEDQRGDGRSVRVREVRLTSGTGHVVVIDPRTRAVLGTLAVGSGTARDLTVPLGEPVSRTGELVALLHADDGDGAFDPASDGAVADDDGDQVDEDFDYTVR
jgi:hypothetical protein